MFEPSAKSAIKWSLCEQIISAVMNFGFSVLMSRLLSPADFGTMAILALFIGVSTVLMNGGMTVAIIQKKNTTHIEESTAFWFNTIICCLMALLLFFLAPFIADLYSIKELKIVTYWMILVFVLSSMNSLQHAIFTKNLNMKTLFLVNSIATVFAVSIAIWMALTGWGMWSLVGQAVTMSFAQTVFTWVFSSWRPLWRFDYDAFKSLFSFGGFVFLSQLLDVCYERAYTALLGRRLGTHPLGIYNRALSTQHMITLIITQVVRRVAFPVFSQHQDNNQELSKRFSLAIRAIMILNVPVLLGLSIISEPLVVTVYGHKWIESAEILTILCIAGSIWPVQVLNATLISSLGRGASYLKLETIKKLITIAMIIGASFVGIKAVAIAVVVSTFINCIVSAYVTQKEIGYRCSSQLKDTFPSIACSSIMVAVLFHLDIYICQFHNFSKLLIVVIVGAISYITASLIIQKNEITEFHNLIRKA